MLIQQSVRKRKRDCGAINNNTAARKPVLILLIGIPCPALVPGERNIQNWLGFWTRQKEQLHGIRRTEAAPAERFRQHLEDVSHSSEKCSSQFPARPPVWRSVSASLQTAGKSCTSKPAVFVWTACSVGLMEWESIISLEGGNLKWRGIGWVSVTMSHAPPISWDRLCIKGLNKYWIFTFSCAFCLLDLHRATFVFRNDKGQKH